MNENQVSKIKSHVLESLVNGSLPCSVALKIAADENVSPAVIGKLSNTLKIKITDCQLGCFK